MFMSKARRLRLTPLLLIVCIGISIFAAGCDNSTSHKSTTITPTPTPIATPTNSYIAPQPCTSPAPDECRFWARGIIAVAVSAASAGAVNIDLLNLVTAVIKQRVGLSVTPYTGARLPSIIPIGTGAVVFLQDSHQDDSVLLSDIDAINSILLTPDKTGASPGYLSVSQSGTWIVGASPDWYGTPAQGAGEHVHGSPDGPPSTTAASTHAMRPTPSAVGTGDGANVYVLDTGYRDSSSYPATGASALYDDLHTVWDEQNVVPELTTDVPGPGKLIPPYEFDQENPAMAALTPTPTYAPTNYRAVNVADHGIAISALIHWLAPSARIHQMRVLNDYGVGDLQALLTTLQSIYAKGTPRSIINLSLNYGPPIPCLSDYWNAIEKGDTATATGLNMQFDAKGCQNKNYGPGADTRRYLSLGLALTALTQDRGDVIVAAAGNGSGGGVHVAASMPAVYCGVVATGAVTVANGSTLADFSNQPQTDCLTFTVGHAGDATEYRVRVSTPITALALGQGVCSLHFQKILPYDAAPPANDLALWSGTSFAAALVTGNIAANRSIVPSGGGTVIVARQTMPCAG